MLKLYKQRLFSTLYPTLLEMLNKMDQGSGPSDYRSRAVQLMMHTCSLVQINHLKDKLHELIPIAEQALALDTCEGH